jgi:hypothetical protein
MGCRGTCQGLEFGLSVLTGISKSHRIEMFQEFLMCRVYLELGNSKHLPLNPPSTSSVYTIVYFVIGAYRTTYFHKNLCSITTIG